jgi:hypothetical protein
MCQVMRNFKYWIVTTYLKQMIGELLMGGNTIDDLWMFQEGDLWYLTLNFQEKEQSSYRRWKSTGEGQFIIMSYVYSGPPSSTGVGQFTIIVIWVTVVWGKKWQLFEIRGDSGLR